MAAIRSIHIHQLLRLKDIHVDFAESGVTAIMGANGTGKTTLLQALACVYRNDTRIGLPQEQYRYTDFFKDYDGNDWVDSQFDIEYFEEDEAVSYRKNNDFWSPPTQHKKVRYSKYINVLDCVPDQEKERARNIDEYEKNDFNISVAKVQTLIEKISAALNRNYRRAQFANKATGLKQFMHTTVDDRTLGELDYPSHYMGAGEQKVIHVMREVLHAPDGAIILIEELEISLHDSVVKSLITFLLEQAQQRNLQIIFTTHWLRIQEFEEDKAMNIVSLFVNPATDVVTVRNGFDPQFIHNLNGDYDQLRQIKLWVEDGLAKKIVEHVAREINIMPFLQVKTFGSIQNAYMIAGAVAIMGENIDRTLVVTDGDRYISEDDKRRQIQSAVDGNGAIADEWRAQALRLIVDLNTPDQYSPEKVILDICQNMRDRGESHNWVDADLDWIAQQNPIPQGKVAMRSLSQHKNLSMDALEGHLLEVICETVEWNRYSDTLKNKLIEVVDRLGIEIENNEVAA